jgi:hypothetical protein
MIHVLIASRSRAALLAALIAGCATRPPVPAPSSDRPPRAEIPPVRTSVKAPIVEVPIVFLERAEAPSPARLPLFRPIADADPRLVDCRKVLENEAAHFIRQAIASAERKANPSLAKDVPPPALAIVLEKDGNHAKTGYRVTALSVRDARGKDENKIEERPNTPYILLECTADPLYGAHLLLHEGGHVIHSIVTRGERAEAPWSATLHSTFAVTDPVTALSEGFAIHLETLWGHYGADQDRRAYYHRLAPRFEQTGKSSAEFYAPARDLQTFSQTFARYQGVRDGLPAFAGNVYPGEYLRSQYDPSRDLATLKWGNAMIASEGVVASVLFWIVAGSAGPDAKPGAGLDQPALAGAEARLVDALFSLPKKAPGPFRPDIVDVVASYAAVGPAEKKLALSRFLDLTRAVTVKPSVAPLWSRFYRAALLLDGPASKAALGELEALRVAAAADTDRNLDALRSGLGPILPVRVEGSQLLIVGFGESFPLELDLNGAGEAEWSAMPKMDAAHRDRARAERQLRPFDSLADFEKRIGLPASKLGLSPVSLGAAGSRD